MTNKQWNDMTAEEKALALKTQTIRETLATNPSQYSVVNADPVGDR